MNKLLIHSLTMFVLTAATAFAGQTIDARIPFTFHVGNSVLPAGAYTAEVTDAQKILRLRSADGKSSIMVLSQQMQSSDGPQKAKFVFKRYGDNYFLRQVWTPGEDTGHELMPSRLEREIAKAVDRDHTVLVAAGR